MFFSPNVKSHFATPNFALIGCGCAASHNNFAFMMDSINSGRDTVSCQSNPNRMQKNKNNKQKINKQGKHHN